MENFLFIGTVVMILIVSVLLMAIMVLAIRAMKEILANQKMINSRMKSLQASQKEIDEYLSNCFGEKPMNGYNSKEPPEAA